MTRSQKHAEFVSEFCTPGALRCASLQDIAAAEDQMQTAFPAAYVSFVTHFGSGATPSVAALAREAEGWPMTQLLSPVEAVAVSRAGWQTGLPRHLVAIAQGEQGDLLCFRRASKGQSRVEGTLWLFIAGSADVVRAFGSLDECLQEYSDARYDRNG